MFSKKNNMSCHVKYHNERKKKEIRFRNHKNYMYGVLGKAFHNFLVWNFQKLKTD